MAKKAAAGKEKATWQQLQNGHKVKVAAWEDEWDHLLQVNPQMPKKDLPVKPRAPWKADLRCPVDSGMLAVILDDDGSSEDDN